MGLGGQHTNGVATENAIQHSNAAQHLKQPSLPNMGGAPRIPHGVDSQSDGTSQQVLPPAQGQGTVVEIESLGPRTVNGTSPSIPVSSEEQVRYCLWLMALVGFA